MGAQEGEGIPLRQGEDGGMGAAAAGELEGGDEGGNNAALGDGRVKVEGEKDSDASGQMAVSFDVQKLFEGVWMSYEAAEEEAQETVGQAGEEGAGEGAADVSRHVWASEGPLLLPEAEEVKAKDGEYCQERGDARRTALHFGEWSGQEIGPPLRTFAGATLMVTPSSWYPAEVPRVAWTKCSASFAS